MDYHTCVYRKFIVILSFIYACSACVWIAKINMDQN